MTEIGINLVLVKPIKLNLVVVQPILLTLQVKPTYKIVTDTV